MAEEAASSFYAVIASWVTPSCLFIFINLVIGTIAVTSRFAANQRKHHHQQRGDSPGQLARSPSLLDRVMSFNLGGYYCKYQPPAEPESVSVSDPVQIQTRENSPRLARAPSLLDRVKSINLRLSKTDEREDPKPVDPTRDELTRTPSLLERFKSMKFYRSGSIKEEKEEPGSGSGFKPDESGIGSGQGNLVEGEEGEEEVNKRADDFINRFKQQLRLQRLESILRYRDMLKGN